MVKRLETLDPLKFDSLLKNIEKPGRYINHEFGVKSSEFAYLQKNPEIVNTALVFPDVYEVGMSNLGLQILYKIINGNAGFNAERAFSPWPDFEASLRKSSTKLFSLENRIFLDCFDLIGFNASHEMLYTNMLNIIDLAGQSLKADKRTNIFPLICCGGSACFNPWPLSSFMDFMVVGDGEEVIIKILDILASYKKKLLKIEDKCMQDKESFLENCINIKKDMLGCLDCVRGVFVPSLYRILYNSDNTVKKIEYRGKSAAKEIHLGNKNGKNIAQGKVRKAILKELDFCEVLTEPVIPNISTVHDRLNIEIMRGCPRGCRFCQAGFIYRPVRQRKVKGLIEKTANALSFTGYDEVSFTSLSSSDYKNLQELIKGVTCNFIPAKISISLPSMRLDSFNLEIAKIIQSGRKTGLTFAPEAGSQRLRDIIKKDINESDLFESLKAAFASGWSRVKLYFMIGLPSENEDDVNEIAELIRKVIILARGVLSKKDFGRFSLSVSVSPFIPKPFTPFQWAGQNSIEELEKKINMIRKSINNRFVKFHWTSPQKSKIECAFSRGDSRIADVLENAWKNGARFDNWSDFFDYNLWIESFAGAKVNIDFYTVRQYNIDEILPWDVIDAGIKKEYFIKEYKKAYKNYL
ncbi:TIGR03960 family B12-binding radical SAM protein [Candidatus Woesearchaeota archaeon]|nr:TIGR03960 family B12-binding radical SAM protein [Candidatus Woesearchaeota archaeon]